MRASRKVLENMHTTELAQLRASQQAEMDASADMNEQTRQMQIETHRKELGLMMKRHSSSIDQLSLEVRLSFGAGRTRL